MLLIKQTQEKIDVVKSRLIKNFGYCEICATDAFNFVASIFAKGDSIKSKTLRRCMDHPIKRDHARFRKIVKGKVRDNLKKICLSRWTDTFQKEMVSFKVPMPSIDTPRFKFGDKQQGGMGQGEGEQGDPVDGKPGEGEPGQGEAGEGEGNKELEVEMSLRSLLQ